MLDTFRKWLTGNAFTPVPEPTIEETKPKRTRKPKAAPTIEAPAELTPKELATANNEPYINVLSVELDPNDINSGSFELDWNDKFILNLVKQGYKYSMKDTDAMIVDRWFQQVCRNIAMEIYEQDIADPENRDDIRIIRQRDIGNGRTEVS